MPSGWVKEPILVFIAIGVLLFAWPSSGPDPMTISVDRDTLIRFIENRTKNFSGSVSSGFDELSEIAIKDALQQYIREEALYRKALALGLDQEDYVIRQRLVQRVEYLSEGQIVPAPTERELQVYYRANLDLFSQPETVTFTHVFFSHGHSSANAREKAVSTLAVLRSENIRFEQAPGYGERFLYQLNYVEKNADEIRSHFGEAMVEPLFTLEPGPGWQGPLRSAHGYHLVMLTGRTEPFVESFDASKSEARVRWLAEQQQLKRDTLIADAVAEYELSVSEEIRSRLGGSIN